MLIEAALVTIVVVVGAALAALGLAMAVFAVRSLLTEATQWRESRRSRTWQSTDGRIVRAVVTRSGSGRRTTWGTRVVYSYSAAGAARSGSRVRFDTTLGQVSRAPDEVRAEVVRLAPGTAVTVFFDPRDPGRATLERNRPGLLGGWVLAALVLLAAFGTVSAGAYVVIGPFQDPPDFAPEELPPLTAQVGALSLLLGAVFAGIGAVKSRRARARQPLVRLVDAAHEYRGEPRAAGTVAVFGRAAAGAAGTLSAPPWGEAAVLYRVRALDHGIAVVEDERTGDFIVDTDHGPVRVHADNARLELPRSRRLDDDAARAWLDAAFTDRTTPAPETFFVETVRLAPGAPVLAVGRLQRGRDGVPALRATHGDEPSLVIGAEPLAELRRRLDAATRRARAAVWVSALLLGVGVSLLLL